MLPLLPLLVLAAPIDIYPQDDLWTALKSLGPGDELIIHAGEYQSPGFVELSLPGTADQPIVIRGADGEVPVLKGTPDQNLINVSGTHYTIRGLELVGGSHGLRLATSAHARLEELEIHGTGDVGISCNRPDNTYEDITIRRVHIHDTGVGGGPGECMYLGCNDGACTVFDSLVEFNWCHDTLAGTQGDGIELKTGSYNTAIRHNVIYNVKYPAITMYGTQGKAGNLVEGNVVWNVGDNGIQTVGDVIVRNNIVLDVGASGIASKPSQGEIVEDLTIVHNTVIGAGDTCLRGNQYPGGAGIVVANNALYCEATSAIKLPEGQGSALVAGNRVLGQVSGVNGGADDGGPLAAAFTDAAGKDLYPLAGSPLIDAGDPAHAVEDDFNCLPRGGAPEVGAYDYSAPQNPGWMIQEGFKECADLGGTDSDTGGTTGTTSGGTSAGGTESDGTTNASTSSGNTSGASTAGTAATDGGGTGDTAASATGATTGAAASDGGTSGGEGSDDTGCACDAHDRRGNPLTWLAALILLPLRRRRAR